ncbi:hypothetical protein ZOSMA_38G00670 [Zostera marina]|uniref:Uncharacterized protein n=1 Tax=Zostera marina TaxID=29655 RepID=A0A0K9P4M2_ZOSMR|nr:hypothetical protein ZOSMA_38G00670 [Zostera marina]
MRNSKIESQHLMDEFVKNSKKICYLTLCRRLCQLDREKTLNFICIPFKLHLEPLL